MDCDGERVYGSWMRSEVQRCWYWRLWWTWCVSAATGSDGSDEEATRVVRAEGGGWEGAVAIIVGWIFRVV